MAVVIVGLGNSGYRTHVYGNIFFLIINLGIKVYYNMLCDKISRLYAMKIAPMKYCFIVLLSEENPYTIAVS